MVHPHRTNMAFQDPKVSVINPRATQGLEEEHREQDDEEVNFSSGFQLQEMRRPDEPVEQVAAETVINIIDRGLERSNPEELPVEPQENAQEPPQDRSEQPENTQLPIEGLSPWELTT